MNPLSASHDTRRYFAGDSIFASQADAPLRIPEARPTRVKRQRICHLPFEVLSRHAGLRLHRRRRRSRDSRRRGTTRPTDALPVTTRSPTPPNWSPKSGRGPVLPGLQPVAPARPPQRLEPGIVMRRPEMLDIPRTPLRRVHDLHRGRIRRGLDCTHVCQINRPEDQLSAPISGVQTHGTRELPACTERAADHEPSQATRPYPPRIHPTRRLLLSTDTTSKAGRSSAIGQRNNPRFVSRQKSGIHGPARVVAAN